jgi:hypothetical protein
MMKIMYEKQFTNMHFSSMSSKNEKNIPIFLSCFHVVQIIEKVQ